MLIFDKVSFRYPEQEKDAISDISFEIKKGELILLCGESGCGKTTLLRHTKKNQIPAGKGSGQMYFCGQDLEKISDRESAEQIGYVGQSADGQIVTDRVWHELAFGLESIGMDRNQMHRRIAEMAEYFGISGWYNKKTGELSGGQKQILNLASVMVLHPKLLVLDEPTAQLDPIAAERFLQNIEKINRDFGVTVLLCEQRLSQIVPIADRIFLMQEGRLVCTAGAEEAVRQMKRTKSRVYDALPGFMRLWHRYSGDSGEPCPLTVREAKRYLERSGLLQAYIQKEKAAAQENNAPQSGRAQGTEKRFLHRRKEQEKTVLSAKEIVFSYGENMILRDFSIKLLHGVFYAVMGGNGSGKTTALKVLAGIVKPQAGAVKTEARVVYVPQNPQTVFTEVTVLAELQEVFAGHKKWGKQFSKEEQAAQVEAMLRKMELETLQKQHPFDLSAGQKQRLALAKAFLLAPEVLLLDEPSKGLDGAFKGTLAAYLRECVQSGMTVLAVSHDVDFCAEYADRCSLLFDGSLTQFQQTDEFFRQNYFYTTDIGRAFSGAERAPVHYRQVVDLLA